MDKRRILLADDEADFLKLMGARIRGWGYEVVEAKNGEEAIDAVMNKNPDIVILDYIMPDMDGVEVLRRIRKIDKKIPVIMFTAHPDIKSMEGAENLGVSAYIPKLSIYSEVQAALKVAIDLAKKKLDKNG